MQKKLAKKDSVLARQLFQDAQTKYQSFQSQLNNKSNQISGRIEYIPFLDSLKTSIRFLEKSGTLPNNKLLQETFNRINGMESRFAQAKQMQQYLRNRQQYLKEQLGKLGMTKELKKFYKQAWYYNAQIEEYKSILKEPQKIERKALELLGKTKAFQQFMNKHSLLASLFPMPDNPCNTINTIGLPGLQTRTQVNTLIQQTAGVTGPNNSVRLFQQNIQQAQGQLQQLKNKINEMGSGSDDELPNFRPNHEKVKSFWRRCEVSTNIQSTRSNTWVPAATQLGFSLGYKLNDQSVIGLGMSGSIGWGKDIRHIVVSYEGVSGRTYVDYKLRGSFWISGGYELNYRASYNRIEQLKNLDAWQPSGLIGLCKKYQVGKKFKGRMSILWDFLSYQQIPRTQAFIFRFGYSIK